MKIYRPLWSDGAFLAPQQFQQQARWDAHVADTVARMTVQELAGHERSDLAVLRHSLTLRLSTQENSAYLTCPVARLPPFTLAQDAPVVVRASRLRSGRRMYWLGWTAGVVVLAALWFTFSSLLSQMVAQIAGQG